MSLFSFSRKNKQAAEAEDSAFYSRAESDSQTVRPRKRRTAGRPIDGETNSPVDPVLPEKKRARRRLVGAVALVLAVIIGLPMVLDSEPKQLADDVSIDIPSKDKPAPARSVPSPSGNDAAASRVPAAAALDQKEEMIDPAPAASVKAAEKTAPKSSEHAHDKSGDKARELARENAGETASAHAAKPAEHSADKSSAKATEKSAEKPGESAKADARHERFMVQVAAFASMDKVNEVRGKLKGAGIASYIQKVETSDGERIRVRVGPLSSREDADRMRAKLVGLGLSGKVLPIPS